MLTDSRADSTEQHSNSLQASNKTLASYHNEREKNMQILNYVFTFISMNFTYLQLQNTVLATVAIIITCRELFIKIERENKKQKEREKEFFEHYIEEHAIQIAE